VAKITDIEGIGKVYGEKLQAAGVKRVEDLLELAATPAGRKKLAESVDVDPKLVLEWANRADLFRVKGLGGEYTDLLEAAGVDTVPELAQRNPENLLAKMREVNEQKNLVRRLPGLEEVRSWVEHAKQLPRKLEF